MLQNTVRRPRLVLESLEARENPSGYVSPYAITGLDPTLVSNIGTSTGTGQLHDALTSTAPAYDPSGSPNPWYDTQYAANAYGPFLNQQPRVALPAGVSPGTVAATEFYMQRIMGAASALIGTAYQHHHDPLWNPYTNGFSDDPTANNYWQWATVSDNANSPIYGVVPDNDAPGGYSITTLANPANPYQAVYGTGAAGIDCSDFLSLVYNVGAGFYMNTAVGEQGLAGADDNYIGPSSLGWFTGDGPLPVDYTQKTPGTVQEVAPQFLFGPHSAFHQTGDTYTTGPDAGDPISKTQQNTRYITQLNSPNDAAAMDAIIDQLQPGDLLYITGGASEYSQVTHVVMWLGQYGTNADGSPSDVPLVISSHDNTPPVLDLGHALTQSEAQSLDIADHMPPPGVQVLPFTPDTWFYQNFSHAMRVLPTLTTVSVASSDLSSEVGQSVTFTATVDSKSGAPGGTVNFVIDGGDPVSAPLVNGVATYTPSSLDVGSHSVAATFVGSSTFAGETAGLTQTVAPVSPLPPSGSPPSTPELTSRPAAAAADIPAAISLVRVYNEDGSVRFVLNPYPGYTGPVAVAVGDMTRDGVPDVVTAAGFGGVPVVVVFDGITGQPVRAFLADAPQFRGGESVAVTDATGDGIPDIVTAAGPGGGSFVSVFDGATGQLVRAFLAFGPQHRGGVAMMAADVTGDGATDIVTGTAVGGHLVVAVYDTNGHPLRAFVDPHLEGGILVG
ncbi:MAG: Ig-like domain repeat protein [Planctomycetes bacterium]|nr:Ig-like domain repeat protein [Planctomycetota bacterium]